MFNLLTRTGYRNFSISSPLLTINKMASVFLKNLPKNLKVKDLAYFFEGYGEIDKIHIKDNYAFVDFLSADDAHNVVGKLNLGQIKGQPIWIELAKPRGGVIDWDSYIQQFKHYTPELLIEEAEKDFNGKDWIMAAHKSYLAAVYSVKILALEQQIHLTAHNEVRNFCEFLVYHESIPKPTAIALGAGYYAGEELHRFTLGTNGRLSREDMKNYINKVKEMVKAYKTMKAETVEEAMKDSKMWEKYFKKEGQILLSGNVFDHKYLNKYY
uniref:RRM domain-containing protein n=1 Tax=Meloidogyne javanica TaxID=6303 RepID=A0A915LT81_MELJA